MLLSSIPISTSYPQGHTQDFPLDYTKVSYGSSNYTSESHIVKYDRTYRLVTQRLEFHGMRASKLQLRTPAINYWVLRTETNANCVIYRYLPRLRSTTAAPYVHSTNTHQSVFITGDGQISTFMQQLDTRKSDTTLLAAGIKVNLE